MKRIISLVLSFAILLTAFCITAYAGTTETNYKYLDRFLEKYSYLENGYLYDELQGIVNSLNIIDCDVLDSLNHDNGIVICGK